MKAKKLKTGEFTRCFGMVVEAHSHSIQVFLLHDINAVTFALEETSSYWPFWG